MVRQPKEHLDLDLASKKPSCSSSQKLPLRTAFWEKALSIAAPEKWDS